MKLVHEIIDGLITKVKKNLNTKSTLLLIIELNLFLDISTFFIIFFFSIRGRY